MVDTTKCSIRGTDLCSISPAVVLLFVVAHVLRFGSACSRLQSGQVCHDSNRGLAICWYALLLNALVTLVCCSCPLTDNMDDVDSGTEVDPTDSQPSMYTCVCVCVYLCAWGEEGLTYPGHEGEVVRVCLTVLHGMLYSVVGGWQLFPVGCNLKPFWPCLLVCAVPIGCGGLCLHVPKSHGGVVHVGMQT